MPQGSIFGSLLFVLHINIMKITNTKDKNYKSTLVLFVDDAGPFITSPNPTNFIKDINGIFTNINKWFKANLLSWNFEKTSLVQFLTKKSSHIPISVDCDNIKSSITNVKFLGIMTDNTLMWKSHIEMIILKLCVACFEVTAIKHFLIWGNSSYSHSIFKIQKRIIRIFMGIGIRDSHGEIFKILNILPLISQYIFSLLLFAVNIKNQFRINSEVHNINTMNNSDFYQPLPYLTIYQKGPFYMGIKVYKTLPPEITDLSQNIKKFK